VIEIRDEESITRPEVEAHLIEGCRIVLFRTRNSALWRQAASPRATSRFSAGGAEYLVKKGVSAWDRLLSIDGFGQDELGAHAILLGASIPVIEGLDLSMWGRAVRVHLPAPAVEGGAAPARVVVRPLKKS